MAITSSSMLMPLHLSWRASPVLSAVAVRPGPAASVVQILKQHSIAPLASDEVLVRMLATTVNPSDLITISGAYGARTSFPFVPGFEGVGEIVEVGTAIPRTALGRRVLPIGSAGNWQEFKTTPMRWCIPVPDDIDTRDACFAYINPLTALLLIERYVTTPAHLVLITGATSTLAGHLLDILHHQGIRPIGLTRGTPGRDVVHPSRWAAVGSVAMDTSCSRELLALTGGQRVDVILDCVGGRIGLDLIKVLRPGGIFVHYGLMSGVPLPPECWTLFPDRRIELFRLRDVVHSAKRQDLDTLFARVFQHIRAGELRTAVALEGHLTELLDIIGRLQTISGKALIHIGASNTLCENSVKCR